MTWNYRIFKRNYDGETLYELHETFYDKDNKPDSWTKEPEFGPYESACELIEELRVMLEDAKKYKNDVLDYDEEIHENNSPT